jgi:hypothetical protein
MKEPEEYSLVFRDTYIDVSGHYEEGEPTVWYYPDGSGHPGTPSGFEIITVRVNGAEIINLLSDEIIEELEEHLVNKIEFN